MYECMDVIVNIASTNSPKMLDCFKVVSISLKKTIDGTQAVSYRFY
jgi:hypothetical protein